ncbi:MAG: SLC13 family permease [Gammaproteobacteria bacterium]
MIVALLAFYLYSRPRIRVEFVSLLLLMALVLLFHLFPMRVARGRIDDATVLSGFGHPVLIAIVCLMILGRGLMMTGALEPAVRWLSRLWRWSPTWGLLLTLLFGIGASAFVNDTPVLVMTLPMLLGIAERTGTSATKTLMPVNFAILGGGMLTTIGTSTNLLVISIAAELGVKPIGIFDFTAIASGALLIALPYLWLVAPRLLPAREARQGANPRAYEARVRLMAPSPLVGRTAAQAARTFGRSLPLATLTRREVSLPLEPGFKFEIDDELLLVDTPAGLRDFAATFAVELFSRDGAGRFVDSNPRNEDLGVAELVIGPKSPQRGKSLGETRFAEQFGVVVIALHRSDEDLLRLSSNIAETVLRSGDLLLVQGPESRIVELRGKWDLLVLDSRVVLPRTPLAPWALGIMAAVIALAAGNVLPIHIAALLGVLAMLGRGCVRFEGLGRALSLEVILLIVASIALGLSLVDSGAAQWLASGVVLGVSGLPPSLQIAAMMTLSAVLTNLVSNSASAAIGTPIAVTVAQQLGLPAEPFVLAILFGANLSYATPMAYQTNLLIMKAAGYSFGDFVRVGLPLVLLMLASLSYLLVRSFGL